MEGDGSLGQCDGLQNVEKWSDLWMEPGELANGVRSGK